MGQRIDVTLECDFCETDKKVETHTVAFDKDKPVEVESCPKCWKPFREAYTRLRAAGRTVSAPRKRRKNSSTTKTA